MGYSKKIGKVIAPPLSGISGNALVRTPAGPRRADGLRVGDLLVTRDNGLQPIRLIWKRAISAIDLVSGPENAPVRLRERAVGPMMPMRSIVLGPTQQVLVPAYQVSMESVTHGGLVSARDVAGTSDAAYFDRSEEGEALYNFVLDTHEIFCASGLHVASFLPQGQMMDQLDGDFSVELMRRFPVLKKKTAKAFPPVKYPVVQTKDYLPGIA